MKKLIIHIGYPKTATTSLQINLLGGLKDIGKIEYLNHLKNTPSYIGDINIRGLYEFLVGYRNNYNENKYKKLLSGITCDISVLSAESLSILFPGFNYAYVSSGAINNAKKLKKVFGQYFDTIEVLISIRSQSEIIKGYFKQCFHAIILENSTFKDIGKWIKENFSESRDDSTLLFNYEALYRSYSETFGKDKIHILFYEDLKYDKEYYYTILAKIFEINKNLVRKYLEKDILNKSIVLENGSIMTEREKIGHITNKIGYLVKRYFGMTLFNFLRRTSKVVIPNFIKELQIGHKYVVRDLSAEEKAYIYDRFKVSNLRLAEIAELDKNKMQRYKYI